MRRVSLLAVALGLVSACDSPQPVTRRAVPPPEPAPSVRLTKAFAVPVLMYHRVTDLTPKEARSPFLRDLSVSPADFEAQVKYLKEDGFTFLYVSEVEEALEKGRELPEKAVAITLDDGYRDNFTEAFPILQKYGAKATVFMVTNNLGRPARLGWDDAKTMVAGDVGFQSHTVSHPDLTTQSDSVLQFELESSKQILESGLGIRVTSLAYPAGAHDDRVVEFLSRAGYEAAWKKGGGAVQPHHAEDPYRLPRIRVHGRTDMPKFKQRVRSGVEIIAMRERSARPRAM